MSDETQPPFVPLPKHPDCDHPLCAGTGFCIRFEEGHNATGSAIADPELADRTYGHCPYLLTGEPPPRIEGGPMTMQKWTELGGNPDDLPDGIIPEN